MYGRRPDVINVLKKIPQLPRLSELFKSGMCDNRATGDSNGFPDRSFAHKRDEHGISV